MNSPLYWDNEASDALQRMLDSYPAIYLLCDTNTKKHCLPLLYNICSKTRKITTFCIPTGEKNKNLTTLNHIWQFLFEQKAIRKSLLLCLGGGILCDMGGFAAATWKRGIDFALIPTTLMAQADAAIGGKTAINFNQVKNQIGLFQPAVSTLFFTDLLHSLPQKELRSGFAEMLKHGLISDAKYWDRLQKLNSIDNILQEPQLIRQSAVIKQKITSQDFKEQNLRLILNFGHTLGHAIESATKGRISHGEAVIQGMQAAARLSFEKGMLSSDDEKKIREGLSKFYGKNNIFTSISAAQLLPYLQHDKKRDNSSFNFTLLKKIGEAKPNLHVSEGDIRKIWDNQPQ